MNDVALSKRLSYVLRHDPASIGITLDAAGWVGVDELLAALARARKPMTRAELDAVVEGNDKRRFTVEAVPGGGDRIRANQGHSVPVDLGLTPVEPPAVLYHGTSADAVASIEADGLLKRGRHHVHLSVDVPTARVVGSRRRGAVAILRVDAAAMAADGHAFYRSANGVWLTDHVPPQYLQRDVAGA